MNSSTQDLLVPRDFSVPNSNGPALPIFDNSLPENFLIFYPKSYVWGAYHSNRGTGKAEESIYFFCHIHKQILLQRYQIRGKNIARQIDQVPSLTSLSRKQTGCTYHSTDPWKGILIREIIMWGNTNILGVIGCVQNISSFGEYWYVQDLIIKLVKVNAYM